MVSRRELVVLGAAASAVVLALPAIASPAAPDAGPSLDAAVAGLGAAGFADLVMSTRKS